MNKNLLKALNIEASESKGVFLLIFQSIFIGIFYGAYDIAANALFLDYFEPSMLTKAYAVSGFAGIILTSLYSWLQDRIKFSHLAFVNLFFIAIITALVRLSFGIISIKIIAFALLVVYGPLRIIALVGFWGSVGRLFSLRQGKRLFGLIDSGWIFGIILSSYIIPVLLRFNFQTKDLLIISSASILLGLLFQFILSKNFNLNPEEEAESEKVNLKERKLLELLKNPYIRVMAVFVFLSMITAFFIQYSFISVTKESYPGSTEFAMFLGFFNGTMMIFILLIKTFVYSRLIKTYGLKTALIISPLLLIFFTVVASLTGSFFGYSSASASFAFFFLLVALSRLFASALKDAIEVPSFKILYQSIDKTIRHDVQAKIDGTINEISALFSGILLAGLSLIPFFRIIHFSYFLVAILVIWAIFAFRLYFQYQHSLQKSLSKKKTSVSPHDEILKSHTQLIKERFNNSGSNTAVLFKALELVDPLEYEEFIINYVFINNSHNSFFISEINRLNLIVGKPEQEILKQLENTIEIKDQVRLLIKNQLAGPASKISFDEIEALATSVNRANKIKACTLIRYTKNNKCIPLLTKLLRDFDKEIRIESIKSSAYVYNNEIISLLIDNIDNSSYTNYVTSALKKIGKDALEILEQTFYKSEIRIPTLIRIIKLLGYIDKPQSHEILLDGIKHVNWDIQYQSILSLQQSKFKPNATNLLHLHESIAELIGVIAWNIAALYSLEEKGINSMINNALENENETNINKLFLLLSTSYDKESIDNVRENLESGTSEGVGFGIELLDQFIADDLKTILFPVLDDSSKAEKIKQLQNHYPVDKTDDIKALYISMINRDINQLNQWTKACALNELKQTDALEINQSLIAQLFNPDQLLNEMAADIISEKSPDVFNECLKRINKKIQEEIRFKFVQKNPMFIPQFKQMLFFNNKFQSQNLKGKSVYRIIKNSSLIFNDEQKRIRLNGNKKLLIIYEGQITLANNQEIFEFNDADIINMFKFTGENIEMEIKDNTKYFEINSNCLSKLLYEDYELLQLFINA